MQERTPGKQIGSGQTADILTYGADQVLKLYRRGYPKDRIEAEFFTTRSVHDHFDLAPQVYGLMEVDGRTGLMVERIEGSSMLEEMGRSPVGLGKWMRLLAGYHLNLHRPCDFTLPKVMDYLIHCVGHTSAYTQEERAQLESVLAGMPEGNTLCHFDFHPGNVLLAEKQPRVIDWVLAGSGDPLLDVARTYLLLRYGSLPGGKPGLYGLEMVRRRMAEMYLQEYLRLSGAGREDVARWELPAMTARAYEGDNREEKNHFLQMIRRRLRDERTPQRVEDIDGQV